MQIITLSGLDGSGKTTQLQKLKKYLQEKKYQVVSFHAIQFSLINFFLKKHKLNSLNEGTDNEQSRQTTIFEKPAPAVTSGNWFTITARKAVLLIDIFRFKKFYRKLKNRQVDFLLSDRYFFDQIINILYLSYKNKILKTLKKSSKKKIRIRLFFSLRLAVKLIMKPDYAFFINTSPKTILTRTPDIEQDETYLLIKQALYRKFSSEWKIKSINGEQKAEDVFQEILKNLSL